MSTWLKWLDKYTITKKSKLSKKEILAARNFIRKEWLSNAECNILDKMYLYKDIALSNNFYVVSDILDKNNVIGILCGRTGKVNLFHKFYWLLKYYFLYFFSFIFVDKDKLKEITIEYEMNKLIYDQAGKIYTENEIVLFLVDKYFRGLGFGTKLFNEFEKDCIPGKIEVLTDTYSSYKFYLSRNFVIDTTVTEPNAKKDEPEQLFFRLIKMK